MEICPICETEYQVIRKDQKCCSSKCSKKLWKIINRIKYNEWQRKFFKQLRISDPERMRFYTKNRRHLLREASNGISGKKFSTVFTLNDWLDIKLKFNLTCPICFKTEPEIKLTIDHIYPLSKGGKHSKDNIQPLCHSCNSRKKDKI